MFPQPMMPRTIATPSRVETAMLVLTILAVAGALTAFVPNGQVLDRPQTEVGTISEAGDAAKQLMLGGFYLLNLMLLALFVRPSAWRFLGLPLLALVTWSFASAAWSVIPDGTIRRAIALGGPVVVGLYAGMRHDEDCLTRALCVAALLAAAGAAVWAVVSPASAFDVDGNLRGTFYHKNAFGLFLALSMIAALYRWIILKRGPRANPLLLLGLVACFGLARSATPVMSITGALMVLGAGAALRRSRGLVLPILVGATGLALIGFLAFMSGLAGAITEVLDRDPTFSGRTTIWNFVIPMIGQRPWFGYGYGIFWLGEGSPATFFWYWTKQFELHAHDGYLQLLLDGGAVAMAMFLASLGLLVKRTVWLSRLGAGSLTLWITAFLGYYLTCNVTDTELWQPNSIMTALFVWAVVRVNLECWRKTTWVKLALARTRPDYEVNYVALVPGAAPSEGRM
jgi:exopolysaccharide production protein ExoQ